MPSAELNGVPPRAGWTRVPGVTTGVQLGPSQDGEVEGG